jgi:hypothetical protein
MMMPAIEILKLSGLPEADLSISQLMLQLVLVVITNAALVLAFGTLLGWLFSKASIRNPFFGCVR